MTDDFRVTLLLGFQTPRSLAWGVTCTHLGTFSSKRLTEVHKTFFQNLWDYFTTITGKIIGQMSRVEMLFLFSSSTSFKMTFYHKWCGIKFLKLRKNLLGMLFDFLMRGYFVDQLFLRRKDAFKEHLISFSIAMAKSILSTSFRY